MAQRRHLKQQEVKEQISNSDMRNGLPLRTGERKLFLVFVFF